MYYFKGGLFERGLFHNFVEQRSAITFFLQNAFGDETMSQKNLYKWYRDFKEGRERVDDLQRSGRPSTSIDNQNINKIKEMVLGN